MERFINCFHTVLNNLIFSFFLKEERDWELMILLRLSAKISVLLRLSVKFFQLRLIKKLKINFFCFKELNVNKPVFFLTLKQNKGLHLGMK